MSLDHKIDWRGHIDGLRAISVLGVLFYHAGFGQAPGGFVGVDVFFVISGFLISKIIYDDMEEHGRFRIAHFYERRIRRIVPVFAVVTSACLLIGAALYLPNLFTQLATSALYASGFAANIFFYMTSDYFGPSADTQPLLHYWSLGVEEQFYIFFPLLVMAIAKASGRLLAPILILLTLSSLVLAEHYLASNPDAAFYLTPLRAWELLAGSILALPKMPFPHLRLAREAISAIGLALIIYAILYFNDDTAFPGLNAAVPVGGAVLILWACERGTTTISQLLSLRPLRNVGLWSYSIYMIHWPLIVFGKQAWPEASEHFNYLAVVLSIGLGWASYRFIETPTRNAAFLPRKSALFGTGIGALSTLAMASVFIHATGGFPARLPKDVQSVLAYNSYQYRPLYRTRTCFVGQTQFDVDPSCLISDRPTILLWGDSHAAALYQALSERFASVAPLSQANKSSCLPVVGWVARAPFCDTFNGHIMAWVEKQKPKAVILTGSWTTSRNYDDQLQGTLKQLQALKIPVVIIGSSPRFRSAVPSILANRLIKGDHSATAEQDLVRGDLQRDRAMNQRLSGMAGVTYISMLETFCQNDDCPIADEHGVPYFWDKDHLTLDGARLAVARMFPDEMHAENLLFSTSLQSVNQ